jgi:serine/threonine protein kinase
MGRVTFRRSFAASILHRLTLPELLGCRSRSSLERAATALCIESSAMMTRTCTLSKKQTLPSCLRKSAGYEVVNNLSRTYLKAEIAHRGYWGPYTCCLCTYCNKGLVAQDAANEIRLLASVKHPNIIRYYETFLDGNWLCIIMEYAQCGDLSHYIKKGKEREAHFPEEVIWQFIIQIMRVRVTQCKHCITRHHESRASMCNTLQRE